MSTLITIDLDALAGNYRSCCEQASPGRVAAVVKADAYGLGLEPVSKSLYGAGCRHFFTATHGEAVQLRRHLADAHVFVLEGVTRDSADCLLEQNLVPVLISLEQIRLWQAKAQQSNRSLRACIHIDTGMTRLGLGSNDVHALSAEPGLLDHIELQYVMTHLACADDAGNDMNRRQLDEFQQLRKLLPQAPSSIGNSAATGLGHEFAGDLARVGISLFGGNPCLDDQRALQPVVRVQSQVLQVRTLPRASSVGYGATKTVSAGTRVATVGIGYADGYPWSLSNKGEAMIGTFRVPVIGRVSMDLLTLDVSEVPDSQVQAGTLVDLIGPGISLEEVAEMAGTLNYEMLTGLSARAERRYLGGP